MAAILRVRRALFPWKSGVPLGAYPERVNHPASSWLGPSVFFFVMLGPLLSTSSDTFDAEKSEKKGRVLGVSFLDAELGQRSLSLLYFECAQCLLVAEVTIFATSFPFHFQYEFVLPSQRV